MSEAELIEIRQRADNQVQEIRETWKIARSKLARAAANGEDDGSLFEAIETDGFNAARVAADTERLCNQIRKLEGRC